MNQAEQLIMDKNKYLRRLLQMKDTAVLEELLIIRTKIDEVQRYKDNTLLAELNNRKKWTTEYLMKKGYLNGF